MAKWKTYREPQAQPQTQQAEPSAVVAELPRLPAGRWMRVRSTRENGVSGWTLDELTQNPDGSFAVKRIHGPDLFDITTYRLEAEVAQ